MTTRRYFLKASAMTAGAFIFPWKWSMAGDTAIPRLTLEPGDRFVDPLPIPAVLNPIGKSKNAASYKVTMSEFQQQILPDKFPTTTVWGYEGSFPGPTIEARRNKPVAIKWINELPSSHFLPIDTSLHGSEPWQPEVRTVVHLHGAHTRPQFDGYPEEWYTSSQHKNFEVCNYKNDQEPAALWYHDHAMGNTRLNVYAGLAGLYNIRDDVEDALNLPSGDYEIPLSIFLPEDENVNKTVEPSTVKVTFKVGTE